MSPRRRRTTSSPDLTAELDAIYLALNRVENVHPDPLACVLDFDGDGDREVVGLIASSLAYGRVAQIHASVTDVVTRLDGEPHRFLLSRSASVIRRRARGFRHRFTSDADLSAFLVGAKRALEMDGSLERTFARGLEPDHETVIPAAIAFVRRLGGPRPRSGFPLLADPRRNSACKRFHLYLRWMMRRDDVDPGVWSLDPARLVVPVDTHMLRVGRLLHFTSRRQADLTTALEITAGFRRLRPEDPVRYDFALTRLGMQGGLPDLDRLISAIGSDDSSGSPSSPRSASPGTTPSTAPAPSRQ